MSPAARTLARQPQGAGGGSAASGGHAASGGWGSLSGGGGAGSGHDSDSAYHDLLRRVTEEQEQLGQLIQHPF
jgi:hypothetical protein